MQGCGWWTEAPLHTRPNNFYLLSHVSNSDHLPPQMAVTFYKTFLQILLNPKEAVYFLSCCSCALCQPVWLPPAFSLLVLCSPHSSGFAQSLSISSISLLIEGELTELTRVLLPPSFLPTFPFVPPSLPEKTEPDGVYDPITAWTHCWILPHSATNTHTLTQSFSAVGAGMGERLTSLPVISH